MRTYKSVRSGPLAEASMRILRRQAAGGKAERKARAEGLAEVAVKMARELAAEAAAPSPLGGPLESLLTLDHKRQSAKFLDALMAATAEMPTQPPPAALAPVAPAARPAPPVQLAPSAPHILYRRENMSERRVRVFTGGDDDYVYPGSIFDKRYKRVTSVRGRATARLPGETMSRAKRPLVLSLLHKAATEHERRVSYEAVDAITLIERAISAHVGVGLRSYTKPDTISQEDWDWMQTGEPHTALTDACYALLRSDE